MSNEGLLTTYIILNNEKINFKNILQELEKYNEFKEGIYINPFNFKNRTKLTEIEENAFKNDNIYSVEFRLNKNNLFVFMYNCTIIIEHSKYLDVPMYENLKDFLNKYIKISDFTLLGFELSLLINEYPENLNKILKDKSLYPIYLYEKSNNQKSIEFKKYSLINSNNNLESKIDWFLNETSEFTFKTLQ